MWSFPPGTDGSAERPWQAEVIRVQRELSEALDFAPLTPDIAFVAFLKACGQFGFFRFGPITIDAEIVEEILLRTHPRGNGGPDHEMPSEAWLRMVELGWKRFGKGGAGSLGQREALLTLVQWGEGLPARVFGELGVSVGDVEDYISGLSSRMRDSVLDRGRLLNIDEASAYLGVHSQTIRAWIRSGKLPAARIAGKKSIRIREVDLERLLVPIDSGGERDG